MVGVGVGQEVEVRRLARKGVEVGRVAVESVDADEGELLDCVQGWSRVSDELLDDEARQERDALKPWWVDMGVTRSWRKRTRTRGRVAVAYRVERVAASLKRASVELEWL